MLSLTVGSCLRFGIFFNLLLITPVVSSFADTNYLSFKTEDESNNIEIFKKASPAIVYITTTSLSRVPFSFNIHQIPKGTGSGFIWNTKGIVVTNFHVIQGASKIIVTLQDHSQWDAKVVGVAPEKELAVLKIDAPKSKMVPLPIGDSSLLEVGRKVLAIGNPFGLDTTLTIGIVSALDREIKSITGRTIFGVIQTDASINPGNSGGPLLNSLGQLIGINTAIISPTGSSAGIGFAVPVNTVKRIVPQLIQHGRLYRPVIGFEPVSDNWLKRYRIKGVPIVRLTPGYPAEAAGMKGAWQTSTGVTMLGDIIISIDGNKVDNNDELLNILEQHKPGDHINVVTKRGDGTFNYDITLSEP